VDEEGAEVFDYEDGAPGDLGACVLLLVRFVGVVWFKECRQHT
jgi:hypothetical protein